LRWKSIESSIFFDDVHNHSGSFFVFEIRFLDTSSLEKFLPFWRNVFDLKRSLAWIPTNRTEMFESRWFRNGKNWFGLLFAKNTSKESFFLLFV